MRLRVGEKDQEKLTPLFPSGSRVCAQAFILHAKPRQSSSLSTTTVAPSRSCPRKRTNIHKRIVHAHDEDGAGVLEQTGLLAADVPGDVALGAGRGEGGGDADDEAFAFALAGR